MQPQLLAATALLALCPLQFAPAQATSKRDLIQVTSSIDGTRQPSYITLPSSLPAGALAPLAVLLHTWSSDLEQRDTVAEREIARRGWILLTPNFRGRNDHAEACGSRLAQQDVLDAVAWVREHHPVDEHRIYVLGMSGGGFMTMQMAARAPTLWTAASAWAGISDLTEWYRTHAGDDYGAMMRQCLGGAPTDNDSIATEYRTRSPLARFAAAVALPVDIAAGRHDTTVTVAHSLRAFDALAIANGSTPVGDAEIAQLSGPKARLERPSPVDTKADAVFGREIFLRRFAGPSRITIFEGGHEWLPLAAIAWLAEHRKP